MVKSRLPLSDFTAAVLGQLDVIHGFTLAVGLWMVI